MLYLTKAFLKLSLYLPDKSLHFGNDNIKSNQEENAMAKIKICKKASYLFNVITTVESS